jgi:hypothetical protein
VGHLVDADRGDDQEGVVLARRDLDPVGVAQAEPAFGDLRDGAAVSLDLVLVVSPGRVAARQARFELTAEGQSLGGQHPLQALPRSFGDLPQRMGR